MNLLTPLLVYLCFQLGKKKSPNISRETLFSFTQNALELNIVANVEVIANDFMSLQLEGMKVSEDVFCAFMVDDPDGIGKIISLIVHFLFFPLFLFFCCGKERRKNGRKEGFLLSCTNHMIDVCCMNG
jgi:hypothetical protein